MAAAMAGVDECHAWGVSSGGEGVGGLGRKWAGLPCRLGGIGVGLFFLFIYLSFVLYFSSVYILIRQHLILHKVVTSSNISVTQYISATKSLVA